MFWPKKENQPLSVCILSIGFFFLLFLFYLHIVQGGFWWIFLTFIVLVAVCHFLFVWFFWLGKTGWMTIEYIYLILALTGIVFGAIQIEKGYASGKFTYNNYKLRVKLIRIVDGLNTEINFVCNKFIKEETSPDNIDDLQREYDSVCNELKKINTPDKYRTKHDTLHFAKSLELIKKETRDPFLRGNIGDLAKSTKEYNEIVIENRELDKQIRSRPVVLIVFAPFFLSLALALKITKVTRGWLIDSGKWKPSNPVT